MGTRKGKRRRFEQAFKQEAVKLSQQAGRTVVEVAEGLGINANILRRWQHELATEGSQAFRGQGSARSRRTRRGGCGASCARSRRSEIF